jgi:hypothetical protein
MQIPSRREFMAASAALLVAAPMLRAASASQPATRPVSAPALGMYVHTHWSYNHPYCARTWSEADWRGYLTGLQALGYDTVMFWPLLDCMPPEPNASDRAFLEKIGRVIRLAKDTFGMKFIIVACPNTIGNDKASGYEYEKRPYFVCEHKVDPKNASDVRAFLDGRRKQFQAVAHADALAVIDSDPGGYIGSTDDEFVRLLKGQADVFRSFHAGAELDYWMLVGWENYNRFWAETAAAKPGEGPQHVTIDAETFERTLSLMKQQIAEPWGVLASMPQHLAATAKLGLADKRLFFPYGIVEGEPSFQLTNFTPDAVRAAAGQWSAQEYPRGIMANAQSHILQLPNTYFFASAVRPHSAPASLADFAEQLIPGAAATLTAGWQALAAGPEAQRAAAIAVRQRRGKPRGAGRCSGLMFADADRYLTDLADNLDIQADLADVRAAFAAGNDPRAALRKFLTDFRPYQSRIGFADACGGPLTADILLPLVQRRAAGFDRILTEFNGWQNLAARHGVIPRLLDALDRYSAS